MVVGSRLLIGGSMRKTKSRKQERLAKGQDDTLPGQLNKLT